MTLKKFQTLYRPASVTSVYLVIGFVLVFLASQILRDYYLYGEITEFFVFLTRAFLLIVVPLVYLPIIYWISGKIPLLKNARNVFFHIFLSLIFNGIYLLTYQILLSYVLGGYFLFSKEMDLVISSLSSQFVGIGSTAFFMYWGLVIIIGINKHLTENTKLLQKRKNLETQLSTAKLSSLKTQLKPHFLFNTLSLVDQLINTKPEKAIQIINKLETLLKSTFDQNQSDTCTLDKELFFLERYLDIEKTRFKDRLNIEYDINPSTRKMDLPCYLLQPLVENAVKHGASKTMEQCTIKISSRRTGKWKILEVSDNGPGVILNNKDGARGIGIKNVEERIKLYYGENARLELATTRGKGFTASIKIPENHLYG